ncbi:MAG: orotidine 5-phosphate decarboxylase [Pseudomonadota bacterium]
MYTCPIELSDVRYNAGTQSFEASVTVHDNATVRRYACAMQAPITMAFDDAAKGLAKQAIRRHQRRGGLFSDMTDRVQNVPARMTRRTAKRWLARLIDLPARHAA